MDANESISSRGKRTRGGPSAWGLGKGTKHPSNNMALNLVIVIKSSCSVSVSEQGAEQNIENRVRRGKLRLGKLKSCTLRQILILGVCVLLLV
jgi:hypothetical protein